MVEYVFFVFFFLCIVTYPPMHLPNVYEWIQGRSSQSKVAKNEFSHGNGGLKLFLGPDRPPIHVNFAWKHGTYLTALILYLTRVH